jgi:2-iminobutanoate/2-iminopropanoate deaminase
MSVSPIPTPSAPAVAGPYSPAVRAGEWIILAGQIGVDPASGRLVGGGCGAQARQVLTNISGILRDCGASLSDVAKTTVFITDITNFAEVNAVYAEAFGDARPARSTVEVAGLPSRAEVEIEAWVHVH